MLIDCALADVKAGIERCASRCYAAVPCTMHPALCNDHHCVELEVQNVCSWCPGAADISCQSPHTLRHTNLLNPSVPCNVRYTDAMQHAQLHTVHITSCSSQAMRASSSWCMWARWASMCPTEVPRTPHPGVQQHAICWDHSGDAQSLETRCC